MAQDNQIFQKPPYRFLTFLTERSASFDISDNEQGQLYNTVILKKKLLPFTFEI
jgi:hypothetical protein